MPISRKRFSKKRTTKNQLKKILESIRKEHLVVNTEKMKNNSDLLVDLEKMVNVLFV